jgi:hypothetical protein
MYICEHFQYSRKKWTAVISTKVTFSKTVILAPNDIISYNTTGLQHVTKQHTHVSASSAFCFLEILSSFYPRDLVFILSSRIRLSLQVVSNRNIVRISCLHDTCCVFDAPVFDSISLIIFRHGPQFTIGDIVRSALLKFVTEYWQD